MPEENSYEDLVSRYKKKQSENKQSGLKKISDKLENKEASNARVEFIKACSSKDQLSGDFLKPYAPDFEIAGNKTITQVKRLLESIRKTQEAGDFCYAAEGNEAFAWRITRFLKDQKLCVPFKNKNKGYATSISFIGNVFKLVGGTSGALSFSAAGKITLSEIPERKKPTTEKSSKLRNSLQTNDLD